MSEVGFAKLVGTEISVVVRSFPFFIGDDPESGLMPDRLVDLPDRVPDIEKEHLALVYTPKSNTIELSVIGRAGVYVNGVFYSPAAERFDSPQAINWRVALGHRAIIQLGDSAGPHVRLMFLLPTVDVISGAARLPERAWTPAKSDDLTTVIKWAYNILLQRPGQTGSFQDVLGALLALRNKGAGHSPPELLVHPAALRNQLFTALTEQPYFERVPGQAIRRMHRDTVSWRIPPSVVARTRDAQEGA